MNVTCSDCLYVGKMYYLLRCLRLTRVRRRRSAGQRRAAHERRRIARVRQRRRSEPHVEQHEIVSGPGAEHHQVRRRQTGPDSGHVRPARHFRAAGPVLSEDDLPVSGDPSTNTIIIYQTDF